MQALKILLMLVLVIAKPQCRKKLSIVSVTKVEYYSHIIELVICDTVHNEMGTCD